MEPLSRRMKRQAARRAGGLKPRRASHSSGLVPFVRLAPKAVELRRLSKELRR